MSFYGNVFQELTNAFASFIIQAKFNNGAKVEIPAVGTGGKFTFAPGNEWIELAANTTDYVCSIKHADADSKRVGTSIDPFAIAGAADVGLPTTLTAGTTVKIPKFKYDQAGHIIASNEYELYKLPINETETNIADLQERIDILENAEMGQDAAVQQLNGRVDLYEGSILDLQERMGVVEGLAPITEGLETLTQNMNDLLGERVSMTEDANITVTSVIGNFDELNETLKYENLCEGLSILTAKNSNTNDTLAAVTAANRGAFERLLNKLEEHNIIISMNDLFPSY